MRIHVFVTALTISAAILLIAADNTTLPPNDLTVHEWGTFTTVAGPNGSSVPWDTLACADDLPGFVHSEGYRNFKVQLHGTVRMETPVIYFYSSHETTVNVKVQFPNGVMTEWYPNANNAIFSRGNSGTLTRLPATRDNMDFSLRSTAGSIEWSKVRIRPGLAADFVREGGLSRYYAARETDSAPLTVSDQNEKFLFYRGVARFQVPLWVQPAVQDENAKVVVENRGGEPVPAAILFENRGGHLGFRNLGALGAGTSQSVAKPAPDGSMSQLFYDLETALTAQGLFLKEAHAMVETWKGSWFQEGSRVIYIVPAPAVDRILPLQVKPAPGSIARAFVGRIELDGPRCAR